MSKNILTKDKLLEKIANLLFTYEQDLPKGESVACTIEFCSPALQERAERLKVYDGDKFVGVANPAVKATEEPTDPEVA